MLRRALFALALLLPAVPAVAQTDPSFNLVNRSGETINEIYVSSVQVNSWGQDLLGANVLANGQTFAVRLPNGQCENDIRVVYASGRNEERRRINTCPLSEVVFGNQQPQAGGQGGKSGGQPAATAQGNPSFNLVNRTNKTIQVVRASLATENNWGEDRLGTAVIPPGGTFAIRLPQGDCVYDVRIEYADNTAEERRRVNLCEISAMTVP
ncbi:hypothetical protein ACE7GA_01555 [Roseomonas sp. CCTCC AB2023176]|uniref:hypothetical protein n=1 Tax=Roseomonas sp. CCTCC AB2023176 TaxID=3342640 RepID=UPI0035DC85F0